MSPLTPFERWWHTAWPHRWYLRRHIPRFLHACPQPFRGEVLEIGAGSGVSSSQILETFPQVELTAIDLEAIATPRFAQLRRRFGQRLRVQQADAKNLPFDRNSFDIVIAISSLHHLDNVPLAMQKLLRVLRPGGLIGISDSRYRSVQRYLQQLFMHASALTRQEVEEILRQENCELVVAKGTTSFIIWAQKPYPINYNQSG